MSPLSSQALARSRNAVLLGRRANVMESGVLARGSRKLHAEEFSDVELMRR